MPFSSITYVTAANFNGDHLVVGSLANGASEVSTLESTLPAPAFTNQTFCGQVQLAPQQLYANVYVPTQAELSGNFSAFAGLLVNPTTNQPYPGGVIPLSQLGEVFAWRIGATQVTSALQGWNPTGPMLAPQTGQASVLLPTGKALVVGPQPIAEIYDPATGIFQSAGALLFNHGSELTATLLSDGRVFILGGTNSPSASEFYDPSSGQFTRAPSPIQPHGYYHTATLLNDGRVLVVGGLESPGSGGSCSDTNAGAELFDPTTGTFTSAGPMAVNRNLQTATLLQDGRVLIAAGYLRGANAPPSCSAAYNSAEIFDPTSNNFTPTDPMPYGGGAMFAALLPNGNVLLGGGDDNGGSAELFNPMTLAFTPTGSMSNTSRSVSTATLLSSGQVLVAGGQNTPVGIISTSSSELSQSCDGSLYCNG